MPLVAPFLAIFALACSSDGKITAYTEPPEVTITTPADGAEVLQAVAVSMRGLVVDKEFSDSLSSLTAQWSVDGEAICEGSYVDDGGNVACVHTFAVAGTVELALTVTNPDGASATATSEVVVLPNAAPTVAIELPDPTGRYYADQLLSFLAWANDGEDAATDLFATWTSDLEGTLDIDDTPDADGMLAGDTVLGEGEHLITLQVEDTTGLIGTDSIIVDIGPPNSPPSCAITAPGNNDSFEIGSTILFEGTATDADIDADELTVTWSSSLDGVLSTTAPTSAGTMTFGASGLSAATHTITLQVEDELGGSCSDAILISVGDGPDVVIDNPTSGDVENEGESVAFQATVTDPDDAATSLDITWESSLDGVLSTAGADSSGITAFSFAGLSVGDHIISVTAVDPEGYYAVESVRLTINGLPDEPVVEIDPGDPLSDQDLTAIITADSTDPEGDAVTYTYAWRRNGASTSYITDTVPASATTRGETWSVVVTPNDPYGSGATGTDSVVVANAPPSVASAAISPTSPVEGDTLTCVAGATSDADGDTVSLSYRWTVDGVAASSTSSTLSSTAFEKGDSVTCSITPNDGYADGTTVTSAAVTVGNSAPTITAATLAPTTAYEASTLTCTPSGGTDADGDTVSYRYDWVVGSSTLGLDSASLTGSWFDKGDAVTCVVTPTDGTDDGSPVSSNVVTVRNTAPQLTSVTLSPTSPTESSTMSCSPGATSDDDGDSVSLTYGWVVDGVDLGLSGSSLSSAWFGSGDTIQCYGTPDDGTTAGAAVYSAVVTVANTAATVASASITPTSPVEGDTLTCVAGTSSDVDGDAVTLSYRWAIDGSTIAATGSTLSSTWFGRGDSVTCTITPNDGTTDGTSVTSAAVVVGNTAPSLASVNLSPTTAYEGSTMTCTPGSATDVDGDTVSYRYDWLVSGTSLGLDSSSLSGSWFDKADTVTCVVTPTDGTASGSAVSSNTVTIRNTAPVLASLSLTPTTATESSTFACTPGGTSDADGDSVSLNYGWLVDGADAGVTAASLAGAYFGKGDTVQCYATPYDGATSGTTLYSATVTVSNTAPSATAVEIAPVDPYTDDTLTATASGWTDPDGDAEGYDWQWYVDGTAVSSGGTSRTLSGTKFSKHQLVHVVATPDDGTATGSPVTSGTVEILNTAPTAPTVQVTPTDAEPEDDLVCGIVTPSADADGDTVNYRYEWWVDGVKSTVTTATLDEAYTEDGDTWTCRVTPYDDDEDGTSASDAQEVVDRTAPDQPVISAIDEYRNTTSVSLSGTAEAGATVTVTMDCTDGTLSEVDVTASSGGTWSTSFSMDRGEECDFVAYATDAHGNVSGLSNTVTTESCNPYDTREDSLGYGDTCVESIDEWSVLTDAGTTVVEIQGNIIDTTDVDWYVIDTSQTVLTAGTNVYNFEVTLTEGASDYTFEVYRGSCATADLECPSTPDLTDYAYFAQDVGGAEHSIPSDSRYCYTGSPFYNNCDDLSDVYYIKVERISTALSCQHYELSISNGAW
ncbi:Ig-like domain-containing protein [Myxococcota bacterium]|nr:Ig-like domain-containing protein [Myxococcota bacterium]